MSVLSIENNAKPATCIPPYIEGTLFIYHMQYMYPIHLYMCVLLSYYIVCISICLSCLLKIMQNLPPVYLSLYGRDTVDIPHAIHIKLASEPNRTRLKYSGLNRI